MLSARLNFVKGHDIVIDAIRALRFQRPDIAVVCLFPGAGDEAEEIKAYAHKDEEASRTFRFLGFIGDAMALRNIYWASDIVLLPSRLEGFGLAIAEAMNCGCVPIRTPSGGWQDQIVDGETGFIVPFNDPQALADRITNLADPARRSTMRQAAIDHAQANFSQEKMVAATSDLYRAVATKPALTSPAA